jgi:hypothetical protein
MEFKKGDLVICVNHNGTAGVVEGNTYKIKGIHTGISGRLFCTIEEDHKSFYSTRFKLAIPNNKLSRKVYPDLQVSDCGKFLVPKESECP